MDKDIQNKLNILEQQVDDLETENNELNSTIDTLTKRLSDLEEKFSQHNHNEFDGSSLLTSGIPKLAGVGDIVSFSGGSIGSQEASIGNNTAQEIQLLAGVTEKISNQIHTDYSASGIGIGHFIKDVKDDGTVFTVTFAGVGKPQAINQKDSLSITSNGNTISSGNLRLNKGVFKDCNILIYSDGQHVLTKEVLDNTEDEITIKGTWGVSGSGLGYLIYKPVMLGSSERRFRSLSLLGIDLTSTQDASQRVAITFGLNPNAQGIYFGSGAPTISANNGSLYLRSDGGSSTTLYIRQGGTWTAK